MERPAPQHRRAPRRFTAGGQVPRRLIRGAARLEHLVGAYLLAGVTVRDETGQVRSRQQFHGPVIEVTAGVVVLRHRDTEVLLPSDPDAYRPAPPGTYRLLSGEVVINPDFLCTWVVAPMGSTCGTEPEIVGSTDQRSDSSQRNSSRAP